MLTYSAANAAQEQVRSSTGSSAGTPHVKATMKNKEPPASCASAIGWLGRASSRPSPRITSSRWRTFRRPRPRHRVGRVARGSERRRARPAAAAAARAVRAAADGRGHALPAAAADESGAPPPAGGGGVAAAAAQNSVVGALDASGEFSTIVRQNETIPESYLLDAAGPQNPNSTYDDVVSFTRTESDDGSQLFYVTHEGAILWVDQLPAIFRADGAQFAAARRTGCFPNLAAQYDMSDTGVISYQPEPDVSGQDFMTYYGLVAESVAVNRGLIAADLVDCDNKIEASASPTRCWRTSSSSRGTTRRSRRTGSRCCTSRARGISSR